MAKFPDTLAVRLTLRYALAFFSFIVIGFLFLYLAIDSILDTEMDEDLEEDIVELRALYQKEGLESLKSEIDREVKPGEQGDLFIRLLNKNGKVVHASDLSQWKLLGLDAAALQNTNENQPVLLTRHFEDHEYETRMIYGVIAPDLVLHIGESFEEKHDLLEIIRQALGFIIVLAIPLASFVSWYMARQAAKGIEEVSRIADEIKLGDLNRRVSVKSKDREIQMLASTFNAMLERINILIKEMRDITDNIAHDLRSPLARIRAISEVGVTNGRSLEAHRAAAADTIEECDRLMRMINTTLDVAEAEAGISHNPVETVNMSELVTDACDLFQPVAEEKHIELKCNIGSDCKIQGNIPNLQRMIANLIDNALKYTPENGNINLDLVCDKKKIKITIADTGIGIPEHEQQRIFERFYRCDQSRSQDGCGMGLSFSRAVARTHGGDITVKSNLGWGTVFTVELGVTR